MRDNASDQLPRRVVSEDAARHTARESARETRARHRNGIWVELEPEEAIIFFFIYVNGDALHTMYIFRLSPKQRFL